MGAWDYCQRGFWHLNKLTGTDGAAAYGLFKTALASIPSSRRRTSASPVP